jgi:diguanylate cyclase (GGDEF)-like protein
MGKIDLDSEAKKILSDLEDIKYKNFIDTISIADVAFKLCKKLGYEAGMSLSLLRKGEALSTLSKYDEALPNLFNSLKLSQANNIYDLQVTAQICIGNILFDLGDYEKSFDSYMLAHKLTSSLNENTNYFKNSSFEMYSARICTDIAEVYKALGDYKNALIYYNEAQRLDKLVDYSATMGISLSNLGDMNYINGNYNLAENLTIEAINYMKHYDFNIVISETYRILASIYEKKEDYKNSKKYFIKAINVDSSNSHLYYKIDSLIAYSRFLINRKDTNNALDHLIKALDISKSNKITSKSMDICKIISSVYEDLGNTYEAYNYYKLYFVFESEYNKIIKSKRANTLKIKTKLQKLENEKVNILQKNETFKKRTEELDQTIKNISIISALGQQITSTQDLDKILEILGTTINNIMDADSFALALYDEDEEVLKYDYCSEKNMPINMPNISVKSNSSIAAYCLRNNEFIVIKDMENDYSKYVKNPDYLSENKSHSWIGSAIYSPLVIGTVLIGIITVQSAGTNAFNEYSIEMMRALSSYAAIAVNNAVKSMNLKSEISKRKKAQYELQKLNNKLLYLSENDSLTGIANRRKFDHVINHAWKKAKLSKTNLSLIILDIDFFKEFNDNYGHLQGDICLSSISKELIRSLPKNYIAARFGGDEFVILLPESNIDDTENFGRKLIKRIENLSITHAHSKISNTVTATMGAASVIPKENITITQFIKCADDALYAAKIKGRNQIVAEVMLTP